MSVQRIVINQWIKKNNTTAEHLAHRAGINPTSLYRFLNGNTDDMRVGTARAISHATNYELDVCDILGIPPRIVYKAAPIGTVNSQKCKHCCEPYNRDVSAHSVNTPSSSVGRVSTKSELLTPVKKTKKVVIDAAGFVTDTDADPHLDPEVQKAYWVADGLLEHWALAFHRSPRAVKLTDGREKKIKAALEDFSVDDLKRCIDGFASDPWRHGKPQFHELKTLLRNTEQIEAGLVMYQRSGLAPPPPVDDSWVARQQEQEALRETQNGN